MSTIVIGLFWVGKYHAQEVNFMVDNMSREDTSIEEQKRVSEIVSEINNAEIPQITNNNIEVSGNITGNKKSQ